MAGLENVVALDLTAPAALKWIKELAQDSSRVYIIPHASKHKISHAQIFKCLRHGVIEEGPARMPNGAWRSTLRVLTAGDILRVVAELDHDESGNHILVITAY